MALPSLDSISTRPIGIAALGTDQRWSVPNAAMPIGLVLMLSRDGRAIQRRHKKTWTKRITVDLG